MKTPHLEPLTSKKISELKKRMESSELSESDKKALMDLVNFRADLENIVKTIPREHGIIKPLSKK